MGFEFSGFKELEKELETKYGKENMERVTDKALKAGADRMLDFVEGTQLKYKDTGRTVKAAELSDVVRTREKSFIYMHWNDGIKPMRYNVIHLQEKGFYNRDGSFNSPDSKGALQRAMIEGRKVYFQTIEDSLRKSLS